STRNCCGPIGSPLTTESLAEDLRCPRAEWVIPTGRGELLPLCSGICGCSLGHWWPRRAPVSRSRGRCNGKPQTSEGRSRRRGARKAVQRRRGGAHRVTRTECATNG